MNANCFKGWCGRPQIGKNDSTTQETFIHGRLLLEWKQIKGDEFPGKSSKYDSGHLSLSEFL